VGERLTLRRTRLKTTVHDSFRGFFRWRWRLSSLDRMKR
jgi:hypothetical protein